MGTSSSYGGPGRGGSLLPPWASEAAGEADTGGPSEASPTEANEPAPSMTWAGAKGLLTRFGSSGGSRSDAGRTYLRSAVSGYVRAQRGARAASKAASAGRRSTQALGGFLSALSANGPERALAFVGLGEHVGSDATTLLGALVDRLSSTAHGLEDNVARSAMTKTLYALFEERGVAVGGLDALRELSADDVRLVVEEYVARYIDERLIQVMGDGLQALPMDEVVLRENEVWDYVRNAVHLDLQGVDVLTLDWASPQAVSLVERIFTEAHRLLENT